MTEYASNRSAIIDGWPKENFLIYENNFED